MTSFLTIGGAWIAHHRLFSRLRVIDATMVELNLVLLLFTAFLPFPTAILAEALRAAEHTAEIAVVLYGATVLVIELVLQALTRYAASRRQPAADESGETKSAVRRHLLSPIVFSMPWRALSAWSASQSLPRPCTWCLPSRAWRSPAHTDECCASRMAPEIPWARQRVGRSGRGDAAQSRGGTRVLIPRRLNGRARLRAGLR